MVWTEDGEPVQGLTGGSERGGERQEWIFPQQWKDGKRHTFFIEMACNTMFGNAEMHDIIQPPPTDKYFKLEKADIVAVNVDARQLLFDFYAIRGMQSPCYENSYHGELLIFDDNRCGTVSASRLVAVASRSAGMRRDPRYFLCWRRQLGCHF